MNFAPYYIIISKIFYMISYYSNWVYSVMPLSWIIGRKAQRDVMRPIKSSLENNLIRILGDFQKIPDSLKYSKDANTVIEWADRTLEHKFDYLGSGLTKLDPINWHIDFKSGFKWPRGTFYKRYRKVDLSNTADVKVPWELSRCHHLLWLGESYLMTKDEKYAKEVIDQLEWWVKENPLMYSINWTCSMDVAIRAVNWMYTLNMISQSQNFTDNFASKIYQSLFEHGWFIYNNLEKWYPYSANHYAANIAGLLYLGQLYKNTKEGVKWWSYAINEFYLEVRLQVLPSGAHFERSISYHRLMTELFAYPYFMLKRTEEPIPLDIHARIESMFCFIDDYTKPNGLAPLIGDNDDGRFLPFVKRDFSDHRYLLNVAGEEFNKTYKNQGTETHLIDKYFVSNQVDNKSIFTPPKVKQSVIKDYRDAGFVIFRKKELFLLFSNSSLSGYPDLRRRRHGTHTHADNLSFVISIGNDDYFIDPGSFVYTASTIERNKFRSTRMHNTLVIDNLNQLELLENQLFSVNNFNEPDRIELIETYNRATISGIKKWQIKSKEQISHFREIDLKADQKLEITDTITCTNRHIFSWYFHLAPKAEVMLDKNSVKIQHTNGTSLHVFFVSSLAFGLNIIESEYSPSYGKSTPTKSIHIDLDASESFNFTTLLLIK